MPQQQRGSASGAYGRNLGRQRPQGPQMYAGGSRNFNEATGQLRNPYQQFGGGGRGGPQMYAGGSRNFNEATGQLRNPYQQFGGAPRPPMQARGQQGQQMQQLMQLMQRQQMMRRMQQQAMMRMLAQRQQGMGQAGPGMGIY